MYTKEEIVAEIRRVAAYLKVETLTPEQFQDCSTIPMNTVEFFMGSWKAALLEARLTGVSKKEPTSKDLLSELWRIHTQTGEVPSYALIDQFGKYPSSSYRQHWRSLEAPFKLAQRYYDTKNEETLGDGYMTDVGRTRMFSQDPSSLKALSDLGVEAHDPNEDSQDLDSELAKTVISAPVPDFALPRDEDERGEAPIRMAAPVGKLEGLDRTQASWTEEPVVEVSLPEYHVEHNDNRQPVVIPDLSNDVPLENRLKGERLNFRGLQFPPADRVGVIFVFGMIANELGFFLETAGDGCGFSGFRTHRLDSTEWSPSRLLFAHNSSDLLGLESQMTSHTHVVCWEHDWSQCPLPVLALANLTRELPNYKRPK
jgi:hypothetical protein